jgi:hypothetical protein
MEVCVTTCGLDDRNPRIRLGKYIVPLPRRESHDAFQSNDMGAASWVGGIAVGPTSGKGWYRVDRGAVW